MGLLDLLSKPVNQSIKTSTPITVGTQLPGSTIKPAPTKSPIRAFVEKYVPKPIQEISGSIKEGLFGRGQEYGQTPTGQPTITFDKGAVGDIIPYFKSPEEKAVERADALKPYVDKGLITPERADQIAREPGLPKGLNAIQKGVAPTPRVELTAFEKEVLRPILISETLDKVFAVMDLATLGTTGATGPIKREIAERIAKSKSVDEIIELLARENPGMKREAVETLSKVFVDVDDPKVIEASMNRIRFGTQGVKAASNVDTATTRQATTPVTKTVKTTEEITPVTVTVKSQGQPQSIPLQKLESQSLREMGISSTKSATPTVKSQDPVATIIQALKQAKPIRKEQQTLYSAERTRRVGEVARVGERVAGEKGYFAQLSKLKGPLPKVEFEGIRGVVTQENIDKLFDIVQKSNITEFEKISAKTGLAKLLGKTGGVVPTKGEIKLLSEIFPSEFIKTILGKRPLLQRFFGHIGNLLNFPRSIMATVDLSAPLRQGIFLIGRPKQFLPAFKDMFRYAFKEEAYQGLMADIQKRSTYKLMRDSKLALTDMGEVLSAREEAFMSNLAEKIPGFGRLARGSNRAYTGFLNKLRADVFDDLVRKAKQLDIFEDNPEVAKDIAKFVNSATGRGSIGQLDRAIVALNGIFFSPRLMASRINLLNPIYYAKLDPFVRKEALKSLFSFAGIAMTVLGLAKLSGAKVGADPRSTDFGKIKVGDTRYDIFGGFQQYMVLASRLITGEMISSTTGREISLGEGYNAPTLVDISQRFLENKTSPVISFALALGRGKNAIGEKTDVPTEVINRFIPMVVADMYDLAKDKGLEGLGMSIPAIFGVGTQTYGKQQIVEGKNKLGKESSQIKPVTGIGEDIRAKLFGQPTLGSSSTGSIDAYAKELMAMPQEEARVKFDELAKTNPSLAEKVSKSIEEIKEGITINDKALKQKGVANGDRALAVAEELKNLKTDAERKALWDEYVKKKIITETVGEQIRELLQMP